METLMTTILFFLIALICLETVVGVVLWFNYIDYRKRVTEFILYGSDIAESITTLNNAVLKLNSEHLLLYKDQITTQTILGVHSEALNTKLLMELFEKVDGTVETTKELS